MSDPASRTTHPPLPRIPASEAPEGVWCIGFLPPVTKMPESIPEGCRFSKADTEKQTVKIGGMWWQWSNDGKSLVPFSDNRGWIVYPRTGNSVRCNVAASGPEEVIVIPRGVLNDT